MSTLRRRRRFRFAFGSFSMVFDGVNGADGVDGAERDFDDGCSPLPWMFTRCTTQSGRTLSSTGNVFYFYIEDRRLVERMTRAYVL